MAFQELTTDELKEIGLVYGQNSTYFNAKTGELDGSRGYRFIEEIVNPEKTQFIIKYENLDKNINNIYAIMNKTLSENLEYTDNSSIYSSYKLYKSV